MSSKEKITSKNLPTKNQKSKKTSRQIYTLGCKVNQVESEEIKAGLAEYNASGVVVINTCTLTERTDAKCRQLINKLQKTKPHHKIIITGCYVERAYDELKARYPNAILVRNQDKNKISELLIRETKDHKQETEERQRDRGTKGQKTEKRIQNPEFRIQKKKTPRWTGFATPSISSVLFRSLHENADGSENVGLHQVTNPVQQRSLRSTVSSLTNTPSRTRAFLKIQDGCNAFCSYCIVPFVRPKLWNKPFPEIKNEIRDFKKHDVHEIVLTGIRIGTYSSSDEKNNKLDFTQALNRMCKLLNKNTQCRLRISSIEPIEISNEFIDVMAQHTYAMDSDHGNICPHLHISIQSGDSAILKAMKRPYDAIWIETLIAKLKKRISHLTITTDVIVGFPGETDELFQNTVDFLNRVEIDGMHIFPFSLRKGTAAENMPNHVPIKKIIERKKILQKFDTSFRLRNAQKYVGKTVEILVEKKASNGYSIGLTPNYLKVQIPYEKGMENSFIKAHITKVFSLPQKGVVCEGTIVSKK